MQGLKVGLAFAKLASVYADEGNTLRAHRTLREAQEAYDEFLRFLPKAKLTLSQREEVARGLPRLKDSLDNLRSRLKIDPAQH
jgi:hypothetical protein